MCFYHSWLGKQSWTIFNVKRQHNQVQKMVYIYRVWNRHETRTSYLEKQHFIAHRTTKHYNREQKSICTTINLTINAISPPHHIKRQISWRITNIVYQFCEFFQAYLFCADDWRREEFLLGCGTLWRPDTSLKNYTKNVQYNKINDSTNILQNDHRRAFSDCSSLDDYTPEMMIIGICVQNTSFWLYLSTITPSYYCHFEL